MLDHKCSLCCSYNRNRKLWGLEDRHHWGGGYYSRYHNDWDLERAPVAGGTAGQKYSGPPNKTRQAFDSPKVETSNSSGWGQAALNLKPQNHGEAAAEEGTKPPAEAWNTLELSFEAKFYLEERSKCRQVLTGSVAPTLGWGSQASWLREESAKDYLPSFCPTRASAWLPLGPRTLRKLLDMFSPVYQNYSDYSLGSFGTTWLVETCIEVTKKMVLRNVGGSSSLRILGPRVQVFVQHCFRLWAGTSATRSGSSSSKDGSQETWEYPFVPYLGLWLACRERKLRGWAKKDFSWQPSAYFNWRSFQHRCDPPRARLQRLGPAPVITVGPKMPNVTGGCSNEGRRWSRKIDR